MHEDMHGMRRGDIKQRGSLALGAAIAGLALLGLAVARAAEPTDEVDTALIVAVDVSNSVDDQRYKLQMEGIARTFEDREIQRAILAGQHRSIFVTLVEWSNRPVIAVPWALIASAEDARAFADRVRHGPPAQVP